MHKNEFMEEKTLMTTGGAAKHYDVCEKTIRTWIDVGLLLTEHTPGGHRRIDVCQAAPASGCVREKATHQRYIITYARVSSRKQLPHRENQEATLVHAAELAKQPGEEIIKLQDIGSGLNFKRKGLRSLLEQVLQRRVRCVVVSYRDRLCRFGFDHFEWLFAKYGTGIVVLNSTPQGGPESIAEDLLAIVTVFSARAHGMRSYKRAIEQELETGTEGGHGEEKEGGKHQPSTKWKRKETTAKSNEGGKNKGKRNRHKTKTPETSSKKKRYARKSKEEGTGPGQILKGSLRPGQGSGDQSAGAPIAHTPVGADMHFGPEVMAILERVVSLGQVVDDNSSGHPASDHRPTFAGQDCTQLPQQRNHHQDSGSMEERIQEKTHGADDAWANDDSKMGV
jgi:putative resolvase